MSTTNKEHKFAILFTGSTDSQYIADMQKVYNTLKDYYGYPEDNLKVFIGTNNAAWSGWTPPGFQIVSNIADFQHSYHGFVSRSTTNHDPQEQALDGVGANDWNTMVLYITGKIDDSGTKPMLIFREADPVVAGDVDVTIPMIFSGPPPLQPDMTKIITGMYNFPPVAGDPPISSYLSNTSLHIVLQTNKAYSFRDDLFNGINSQCLSLTFATDSATVNPDIATGSLFTGLWTDGLKLIQNGGGLYADEIDTLVEPIDNLIVSTRKACKFVHGDLSLFAEKYAVGLLNPDDFGLGKPVASIMDGTDHTPPRAWYESPDIWITCPPYYPDDATSEDNDYYVYDEDNNIYIRAHVDGSHPVRKLFIGAKVFKSGGGGAGEVHTDVFTPVTVLTPGSHDSFKYTYHYISGFAHSCIKARVSMEAISSTEIDDDPTNEWDPHYRGNEAQRNTDPSALKSSSGGAGGGAGEGKIDEEAPEEAAEPNTDNPETETDTKTTNNLRGFKEHIYVIKNPFKYSRDFRYTIDPELLKRRKELRLNWMAINPKYPDRLHELKVIMEPYPHIPLELKPGAEIHILNYIGLEKGVRIEKPIVANFNIEMGFQKVRRLFTWRLNPPFRMKFRKFSGVTMRIMDGSFDLTGTLRCKDKKALKGAVIIAKTIDGRQSAATRVNEKGEWGFQAINPDIYQIWAKSGKQISKKQVIHGLPVHKSYKPKPIVLEL
jgi:hypothetical protein